MPEGTDFNDLTGPLPLGPNGQGAYLLGKYEVTRLQAAALRAFGQDADCPRALDPDQTGQDQALVTKLQLRDPSDEAPASRSRASSLG